MWSSRDGRGSRHRRDARALHIRWQRERVAVARSFRFSEDQGWREIAPMPALRSQGAAVALGGAANDRLVSGGPTPGTSQTPVCETLDVR